MPAAAPRLRSMPRNAPLIAAALTGAGATALAGGAALLAARQLNGPRRPDLPYTFTPFELGVDSEAVDFTAADGTTIRGWWLDAPGAERSEHVVIASHGFRGDKSQMLGIGTGLHRAGASVLLFDFRGNGDSDDGRQSLGHYEQQDLRAAIAFARTRRPDARIDLLGFSMGAAVSILVAAEDPTVSRVVADSSFADMHGVVAAAAASLRVPGAFAHLVDLATRRRYGYGFSQVRPIEAISRIEPRPLLMFHGTEDSVIPVEHAHRLARAAGASARLVLTEGADHCGSYFADRPGYIDQVARFLLAEEG